jgi:pilus assembly protein CpaE
MPGGLKRKHVLEGLGAAPEVIIPDLPRVLPRAANLGRPALARSAALRRALAPAIEEVAAVHAGGAKRGLLARLVGGRG